MQVFGCKKTGDKIGILVAQLGTPESPTPAAVRRYLKEFLWDRRVIEKNRALWWLILNGIVLRVRPKKSAALYKRIWREAGSPIRIITDKQAEGLKSRLAEIKIEVEVGMRYGAPSLESAIDNLIARGVSKILLFPMYPQYSATTCASVYDAVFPHLLKRRLVPTLKVVEPYFRNPAYLKAQAEVINQHLASIKPVERLILSYHGVPEEYVEKGDPYCCQCTETTARLLPLLEIGTEKVIHTYQSRFGKDPWLVPYTDETLQRLAKEGVKRVAVALPGFTADCLETLDEIGNEAREEFEELGGEKLELIPCLNDHPAWLEAMHSIALSELGGWVDSARQLKLEQCKIRCPMQQEKAGKPQSITVSRVDRAANQ